ncbi:MAG: HAD-IA family hydrolase [Desulfopila sp.]
MPHQNRKYTFAENIRAITFDAVGTLIVPSPSVGEIYTGELRKFGYDIKPDLLENNFIVAFKQFKNDHPDALLNQDSWRSIVASVLHDMIRSNDFEIIFTTLWHEFANPKRWSILPGVEETLSRLKTADLRLFVLSNNDERLHAIFQGLSIGKFFEKIFVSSELGAEKPSRQIFSLVQAHIRVAATDLLHVGDSPTEDVQGALKAGWHAALVGPHAATSGAAANFRRADSIAELFAIN